MEEKNMAKLTAVINEEVLMIQQAVLTDLMDEMFNDTINKIEEAITNMVIKDQRFIDAVGKRTAKKTRFHLLPLCYVCDECDSMQYIMQLSMTVGDEDTDFHYEYYLLNSGNGNELSQSPSIIYTNDGKSQLMKVFEYGGNGVTSTKTFKNLHGDVNEEVTVEDIYEEILSEADLRIY